MRENLEESDEEEGSAGNALQNPVADVLREADWQVGHRHAQSHPQGAGQAEQHVGQDEALGGQAGLGGVETQTEGHDSLVDDDCNEDGDELGGALLQPYGHPLEHGVEGEGYQEHEGAES